MKNEPITENIIDTPHRTNGNSSILVLVGKTVFASIIDAMIVTTYVSKRSAAIQAQSQTLSPTLSAITAGFLGSSSGIQASTLPTRSAQTSAALVKIQPPRRANTEISEPQKPNPIRACIALASPANLTARK
jgi:hypothetical protein